MKKPCGHEVSCNCMNNPSDLLDKAKNLIERCIRNQISLEETKIYLSQNHDISPQMTDEVWAQLHSGTRIMQRVLPNTPTPTDRLDLSTQSLPYVLPDLKRLIADLNGFLAGNSDYQRQIMRQTNPTSHRCDVNPQPLPDLNSSIPAESPKKKRLKWNANMEQEYNNAITELGGLKKATPKKILDRIGSTQLTRDNVKSRLQLDRNKLKQQSQNSTLSLPDLNYPKELLQFPDDQQHHRSDVSPQGFPLSDPIGIGVPSIAEASSVAKDPSTSQITEEAPTGNITEEASMGNITEEAPTGNITEEASMGNITEEAPTGNITEEAPTGNITEEAPAENISEEASMDCKSKKPTTG